MKKQKRNNVKKIDNKRERKHLAKKDRGKNYEENTKSKKAKAWKGMRIKPNQKKRKTRTMKEIEINMK